MIDWQTISKHISHSIGADFKIKTKSSVAGGDINSAYQISGIRQSRQLKQQQTLNFFVKINSIELQSMFQLEYESLIELSQNQLLQIPHPVCFGVSADKSYLVLEYLTLQSRGDSSALGRALANMHQITAKQYGWQHNNFIGSTPQSNQYHNNWLSFWRDERIIPQFEMLYNKGYQSYLSPSAEQFLIHLESLLIDHHPPASLLHGDLWSGNYAYSETGQPVIFDPALYYGDRETDLAMTELFGGFDEKFYTAYNEVWPLEKGYKSRKTLYNLYHILNHANLFGSSYLNQAINMLQRLC